MMGRPPIFETPEEIDAKIEEYFAQELTHVTITGLAYYLGFESRQSFYDYEKHEEFSYIIKRARLRVEQGYENELFNGKPVGAIFALKNMGWADRQEIKHDITHLPRIEYEMPPDE